MLIENDKRNLAFCEWTGGKFNQKMWNVYCNDIFEYIRHSFVNRDKCCNAHHDNIKAIYLKPSIRQFFLNFFIINFRPFEKTYQNTVTHFNAFGDVNIQKKKIREEFSLIIWNNLMKWKNFNYCRYVWFGLLNILFVQMRFLRSFCLLLIIR